MLYHKDIGFPKSFNSKIGTVCLTYSNHAHEAARSDKYGPVILPRTLNTSKSECIEIEMIEGRITKLVYRMSYNAALDLSIVCVPKGNLFCVSTIWLNLKTDEHINLNMARYNMSA